MRTAALGDPGAGVDPRAHTRVRERRAMDEFLYVISNITIAPPLEGGSGLTGKTGRKTANA